MSEQFSTPGTCKIHNITILNSKGQYVDVTNLVAQLNLYEDMLSPFVTGSITMSDASGIASMLPLIGEELISMEIETPYLTELGLPFNRLKKQFYLYKMSERENVNLKNVLYTLHFASIEAFVDANTKISQAYSGRISNSVQKIIEKPPGLATSKNTVIETTSNSEIHVSNFWSPTKNIFYLASRALNTLNNPNFFFFENNEGFIFMSLDTLMSAQPQHKLIRSQKMRDAKGTMDVNEEYTKILDMSVPVQYDYFERLQQGYYGGRVYHLDLENKTLNVKNLVAKDDVKKVQLNKYLQTGPGIAALPEANLAFVPEANQFTTVIQKNLHNGSPSVSIDHDLRRMALLKQLDAMKINVQVYGKLDYSVGRVVDFTAYIDAPVDETTTVQDSIDPVLSGRYLITALSHEITPTSHVCNLELSKDSLAMNTITR
jgi:hypothetical protein